MSREEEPAEDTAACSSNKAVSFRTNANASQTTVQQQQRRGTVGRPRMDKTASQILLEAPSSRNRKTTFRRHELGHFDLTTGRKAVRLQSCRELNAELQEQQGPRSRWQKFRGSIFRKEKQNDEATQHRRSIKTTKHDPNARYFRLRSVTGGNFNHTRRKPFWLCLKPMQYNSWISGYLRWSFRASFTEVALASFVLYIFLIVFFAACIQLIAKYVPRCFVANEGYEPGKHFMDAFQLSWTTLSTVGYGVISPQVSDDAVGNTELCLGINAFMAFEAFLGVLFGGILSAVILGKVARIQSVARVRWSDPICVRYGTGVSGVASEDIADDEQEEEEEDQDIETGKAKEIPCPILEFRLANELSGLKGGEVVDASVTVVATILVEKEGFGDFETFRGDFSGPPAQPQGFSTLGKTALKMGAMSTQAAKKVGSVSTQAARTVGAVSTQAAKTVGAVSTQAAKTVGAVSTQAAKSTGAALLGATRATSQATGSLVQRINYQLSRSPGASLHGSVERLMHEEQAEMTEVQPYSSQKEIEKKLADRLAEKLAAEQAKVAGVSLIEETRTAVFVPGDDSGLAPAQIFHKLSIETDTHPFMKRMWNIRHCLDASSPLLSDSARRMIQENDGFWPEELNHYSAIREHLHFHEIIVTFSGTANVSGSTVFSQKVYAFVDVNVGYSFAQILHVSSDGKLTVDMELLNDVKEQVGGGGEPFVVDEEGTKSPFTVIKDTAAVVTDKTKQTAVEITDQARQTVEAVADKTKQTAAEISDQARQTAEAVTAKTLEIGRVVGDQVQMAAGDVVELGENLGRVVKGRNNKAE